MVLGGTTAEVVEAVLAVLSRGALVLGAVAVVPAVEAGTCVSALVSAGGAAVVACVVVSSKCSRQ